MGNLFQVFVTTQLCLKGLPEVHFKCHLKISLSVPSSDRLFSQGFTERSYSFEHFIFPSRLLSHKGPRNARSRDAAVRRLYRPRHGGAPIESAFEDDYFSAMLNFYNPFKSLQ